MAAGNSQQSYDTRQLEEEFMQAMEMKARLQRSTKGKGSLTLYFTNEDQFERLYERLSALRGMAPWMRSVATAVDMCSIRCWAVPIPALTTKESRTSHGKSA